MVTLVKAVIMGCVAVFSQALAAAAVPQPGSPSRVARVLFPDLIWFHLHLSLTNGQSMTKTSKCQVLNAAAWILHMCFVGMIPHKEIKLTTQHLWCAQSDMFAMLCPSHHVCFARASSRLLSYSQEICMLCSEEYTTVALCQAPRYWAWRHQRLCCSR